MLAHGHWASGVNAGLIVGDSLQLAGPVTALLALAGGGAAVLCDIDCRNSTVTTAFGPVSELACDAAIGLHHAVASAMNPLHNGQHGAHRGLTHWWPWWLAVGGAVAVGCQVNRWVPLAVLSILLVLSVRAATIPQQPEVPQSRFKNPQMHKQVMGVVYWVLEHTPHMYLLRHARKYVTRTKRLGGRRIGITIATGKIGVIILCAAAIFGADYYHQLPQVGPWLGLLIFFGHFIHWCGDLPTHMGVPGIMLYHIWKLPRWCSFYAGGPFEVFCLWIPMDSLAMYLSLGTMGIVPHSQTISVLHYIGYGLIGIVTVMILSTKITKHVRIRKQLA
jgi:hypothetical protein